jgi:hypothetical protein
MSTASAPYYWLVCDGCGVSSGKESDYAAWSDEESAREVAEDANWGWLGVDLAPGLTVDLCWSCRPTIGDDDEWTDDYRPEAFHV